MNETYYHIIDLLNSSNQRDTGNIYILCNSYKPIFRFVYDLQIPRLEGEARVAWVCES